MPLLLCVRNRNIVTFVLQRLAIELEDLGCHIPFTAENLNKWSLYTIDRTSNSNGCYIGTELISTAPVRFASYFYIVM